MTFGINEDITPSVDIFLEVNNIGFMKEEKYIYL
jgi:hypothetical protein